ncbi:hypothetical protein [Dysgonomonas macrotermitis]|uniref:DUF3999 domain-containing protein n=1 Tax=Dysgonomonas macrotermitis TaxID=1346286 RepID=A0A1M5HI79_9BACT|nr:hypothetical protein [Dysgonomonas macrotermitis]SHG15660.1 hypothetical protein SAMN05444362_11674 [Dysgonomonas macrotermitis]
MKRYISTLLLATAAIVQTAAHDWYKAEIKYSVPKSGYYNIELNQDLIATSRSFDFSDLRILDKEGKETPYFARPADPVKETNRFITYNIKSSSIKDSINTIVIDNTAGETLSRFSMVVRSADAAKYVQVRGSSDLSQWYIVKQQSDVTYSGFGQNDNSEILVVDFPKGNYKYYEIRLTTNQHSPIEVLRVGRFHNSNIYGQLTEIDLGKFTVKDSTDKCTYIRFPELQYPYRINKLRFVIKNTPDYYRQAYIKDKQVIKNIALSSRESNTFFFTNQSLAKDDSYIRIENKDNRPLEIDSIRAYGLNRYLCAYLEEGQSYTVVVQHKDYPGNPQYDLQHFSKDIPEDLPIITTSKPEKISEPEVSTERSRMWFEQPLFLWSVIIIVGLFLLGICYKMVMDMKKKDK